MTRSFHRIAFAALLLGGAACMPVEPGQSGLKAGSNRIEGENGFAVVSSSPSRTVFAAKGQQVVIAPASGFCVTEESLNVSGTAAFALVSDCAAREIHARAFPGILTVSVSGDPMIPPGSTADTAINGLIGFLAGDAGEALLGRGGDAGQVSLEEMRRVGDGLYVLVRDGDTTPLPVLHPRFWRAFVELGGRMAMITVSGFRAAPVEPEQMLAFLVAQVVALKQANEATPTEDELRWAGRLDDSYRVAASPADTALEPYVPGEAPETPAVGQGVATLPAAAGLGGTVRGPAPAAPSAASETENPGG